MSTPGKLSTDEIDVVGAKLFTDTIERLFPLLGYISPFGDITAAQVEDTEPEAYPLADLHGWGGSFAVRNLTVMVDVQQGAAGTIEIESSYRVQVIHPPEQVGKHAMRILQEYELFQSPLLSGYSEYPEVWDNRRKAWRRPEFIHNPSDQKPSQQESRSILDEAYKVFDEEGFEAVRELWATHHELAKSVGLDNTFTFARLNTVIALLDGCNVDNKTDEA